MKRVLITGADSYIGMSVESWLSCPGWAGKYQVNTVDMRRNGWRKKDFSAYDTVLHVAGIAHQKERRENWELYYRINRDLAIEAASKAKKEGVRQFILISTMNVYGKLTGSIRRNTIPVPVSHYGKSKLQADLAIRKMGEEAFRVAIVRPPMVYGKGCKGNYQILSKYAKRLPIFPRIENQRSMIYVEHLSIFVKKIIDEEGEGIFHPQNHDYVCTSEMVRQIAGVNEHGICLTPLFHTLIESSKVKLLEKIFGNLVYEEFESCDQWTFEETIRKTEL